MTRRLTSCLQLLEPRHKKCFAHSRMNLPKRQGVPAETAEQCNTVVRKSTEVCVPRKKVVYEQYVFHTRVQDEGETIDRFTTDLRLKSYSCEFGSLQDCLIRDRVVMGIRDSTLKKMLLRANVRTHNRHLQSKRSRAGESLNWRRKHFKCERDSKILNVLNKSPCSEINNKKRQTSKKRQCNRCETAHKFRECPA